MILASKCLCPSLSLLSVHDGDNYDDNGDDDDDDDDDDDNDGDNCDDDGYDDNDGCIPFSDGRSCLLIPQLTISSVPPSSCWQQQQPDGLFSYSYSPLLLILVALILSSALLPGARWSFTIFLPSYLLPSPPLHHS